MIRPSASRAMLLTKCVHWLSLNEPAREERSAAATIGVEGHALNEAHVMRLPKPETSPEARALHAAWLLEIAPDIPAFARAEVAFAWDPTTDIAVELGVALNRDYSRAAEGTVVGTADLVYMAGDAVVVRDWKFSNEFDVDHEKNRAQLRALALMAARAYKAERAITYVDHVRDGGCESIQEPIDALELDAIAAELREAMAQTTEPKPGGHCKGCSARASCPATAAAMVQAPSWAIVSAEDVARVWDRIGPIEAAIESVKAAARELVATNGPIALPNGKRLKLIDVQGRESCSVPNLAKAVGDERMAELREAGVVKRGGTYQSLREVG